MGRFICRRWAFYVFAVFACCKFGGYAMASFAAPMERSKDNPASLLPGRIRIDLFEAGIEITREGVKAGLENERVASPCVIALGIFGEIEDIPAIMAAYEKSDSFVFKSVAITAIHRIVERHNLTLAESFVGKESLLDTAILFIRIGDTRYYRVVLDILGKPESGYLPRAVSNVPKFARFNILDDDLEPVDWVEPLRLLLLNPELDDNFKSSYVVLYLRDIGSRRARDVCEEALNSDLVGQEVKSKIKFSLGTWKPTARNESP